MIVEFDAAKMTIVQWLKQFPDTISVKELIEFCIDTEKEQD
jgi:hypothetical protein